MLNIDSYLSRVWSFTDQNCWHVACDAWFDLTGIRIHSGIEDFRMGALHATADHHADQLVKLQKPQTPCLVLMQRRLSNPHVGVFIDGKILHMNDKGVSYMPAHNVIMGYTRVTYYTNP